MESWWSKITEDLYKIAEDLGGLQKIRKKIGIKKELARVLQALFCLFWWFCYA